MIFCACVCRWTMNQYFLAIACLQLIPQITPVNALTTWVPLAVIFAVTAIKEGFDDLGRWRADNEANGCVFNSSSRYLSSEVYPSSFPSSFLPFSDACTLSFATDARSIFLPAILLLATLSDLWKTLKYPRIAWCSLHQTLKAWRTSKPRIWTVNQTLKYAPLLPPHRF